MKKRTPRNYFGTEDPTKKVAEMLPEMLNELSKKAGDCEVQVFQAWISLIGEKMAPMTEPVSFLDGVLTVKVKSSTLYHLLVVHERARLLRQLQEKFSIRNLVFRVG